MNDACVAGFIGFVIGLVATFIPCVRTTTPNSTLREVGIERIAYCCNAHSNWYEIVWKTEKTKEVNNDR